jgi:hypothetical protein
MAQQTNDLRERLLATLPQPENLAAYRGETAALLTRHAKALRWDKVTAYTFSFLAVALFLLLVFWRLGGFPVLGFQVGSAVFFFMGVIYKVHYEIYDSQVATLKEIKQVQLQILELQASLQKDK